MFSSTHDAYPSFSTYPRDTRGKAAALVMIGSRGPHVAVSQNEAFTETLGDAEDKKQFYSLYVQLKLLKGEFSYDNKDEVDALSAWIKGDGVTKPEQLKRIKEMRNLFQTMIQGTKTAQDQIDYSKSHLRSIFDKKVEYFLAQDLPVLGLDKK